MLKVLFINATNSSLDIETITPSVGTAYLVSYARKYYGKPIEFKIIDKNVKEEISVFKPDIVGISSVSSNYNIAKEYGCKRREVDRIHYECP